VSRVLSIEPHEWSRFSLPHCLRLVGEHQHLLGGGSVSVATNLRAGFRVQESGGPFALRFGGGREETGQLISGADALADVAVLWEGALRRSLADPDELTGVEIEVDFGPLWRLCPRRALALSPAVAAGLMVAAVAHRSERRELLEGDLAEEACRLLQAATDAGPAAPHGAYADALMSLVGGAGYVEPGGERMNVQQLLPPDSLLLVIAAEEPPRKWQQVVAAARRREEELAAAVRKLDQAGAVVEGSGDAAFEALFEAAAGTLDDRETTMLYGLMRVRQMAEAFLEFVGEPFVDNDRLAEICDEESAILADYFEFPAELYAEIRARAGEEGALGAKLTWAFGGVPASIILAPARRTGIGRTLAQHFPDARCLPVAMEPAGLLSGEDELWVAPGEF
jgi:hypothetical protein